jgi:hypothetical protein
MGLEGRIVDIGNFGQTFPGRTALPLMPTLSVFFGISIRMYDEDHVPPHFHAVYGADEAVVQIDPLQVLGGDLPPRARSLVFEWAGLHRDELLADWTLARARLPLKSIPPLQ